MEFKVLRSRKETSAGDDAGGIVGQLDELAEKEIAQVADREHEGALRQKMGAL